ncbi:MAG: transcription-repair coupling factor [Erysipelothrix sp.]|nr:transcription-repair coupling factor [Erysipelothrix sp.]
MYWLKDYLRKNIDVKDFINKNKNAAHLSEKQESLLLYGVYLQKKTPLFVVKENESQMIKLKENLYSLDPNLRIITYSHEESLRVEAIAASDFLRQERISALYSLMNDNYDVCITYGMSTLRKISPKSILQDAILELSLNQIYDPKDLVLKLESMGYRRVKYVERPFTYALRGGICDVYSVHDEHPLRIEFFDIEIDSLRYFDIDTQRSIKTVDKASLIFASDVLLKENDISEIKETLSLKLKEATIELQEEASMQLDLLENMQYEDTLYPYLANWTQYETVLDFINNDKVIISPIEAVMRNIEDTTKDTIDFVQERNQNDLLVLNYDLFAEPEKLAHIEATKTFEYEANNALSLHWHSANIVSVNISDTLKHIQKESKNKRVILALSEEKYEEIIELLIKQDIVYQNLTDQEEFGLYLYMSDMMGGFIIEDIDTVVYTEKELFHFQEKKYHYDSKFFQAETLQQINELDTFDYVVHRQYGIGKYMGISTKEIDGIQKDFMRIQYKDGDELFVPLEQFNLVRKYISSEALAVRLSKLGTSTWKKNQERIKNSINDIADKLLQIYSDRSKSSGYAFSKDTEYQIKFEKEFPYQLTRDQAQAVEEIKRDMESSSPMDRLLCGDVGFGKTEVAIRAAFKAIVDEKQIIFLCPTTILSQQHYKTFIKRFENYPVTIEVLNRFVSPLKQKDILKRFKEGHVDILIGTHRVLSKDVKAHDLGLLIIDEEQRFGVEHKEKIKEYKVEVDVLSLSATPIPRTLQMSLIGIRSLSQLNTPPSNRLPVMTYVIEKNQKTIYDVLQKELNREGQAFYLYNNIDQIYSIASTIQAHVTNARVGVVHGQMDKNEIEDIMMRFVSKELNILVTTTIIETGIDIPNANTILVDNAHRFGLSQLYQIKGRVGRSDRLAYAYFIIPEKRNLTEVASKRLQAIKEFTQLGSGYKIAMRDLTIRGAGELLGGNQSGFIDSIGIELYVELLKEAIDIRQGKQKVEEEKQRYNLNVEGFIPDKFTTDDQEKLDLYQQIDKIKTITGLKVMIDALKDRYGKLPNAVDMLLEKKRLEILLEDSRIESFKELRTTVELTFTQSYSDNMDGTKLFEIVSERSYDIKIKYIKKMISLTIPKTDYWFEDLLYILENIKD